MTHVLIVSVGPVQEFIASARKCRDLWFGSWLLSELSFAAAEAIETCEGAGALVFPGGLSRAGGQAEVNVANKIVARVADPIMAARAAERAVADRLMNLAQDAFRRVGRDDPKRAVRFLESKALDQVRELIECLWAHAEERAEGGYGAARSEAERLLAARKNSKQWSQPSWAGPVPKSSLDGVRESVLDESLFDEPRGGARTAPETAESVRKLYGVHGAERLCGVGVFKRFGRTAGEGAPERVFSTSHVAALPFLDGLERISGARAAFDRLVSELGAIDKEIVARLDVVPGGGHPVSGSHDGAILYPGRLLEIVEEVLPRARWKDAQETACRALSTFLGACKNGEPSPYFAVLLADGDNMGKVIDEIDDPARHKTLSRALEDFASKARSIVTEHGGRLIYSGGDDVLAFVPVHRVQDCAKKLAYAFAEPLRAFKFTSDGGGAPTLSMGIAVVHALVPLDDSLEEARHAEKFAKAIKGKDAICLRVVKRGGTPVELAGKRATVLSHLERFVTWHREGAVSSKAQYELMDLERLAGDHPAEDMKALVQSQAQRVIDRRRASGGGSATVEIHARVHDAIHDLGGPAATGRALYVAQLIARAMDQAAPKKKESR